MPQPTEGEVEFGPISKALKVPEKLEKLNATVKDSKGGIFDFQLLRPTTEIAGKILPNVSDPDGSLNPFHLEWLIQEAREIASRVNRLEQEKNSLAAEAKANNLTYRYDVIDLLARIKQNEALYDDGKRILSARAKLYEPHDPVNLGPTNNRDWITRLIDEAKSYQTLSHDEVGTRGGLAADNAPKNGPSASELEIKRANWDERTHTYNLLSLGDERSRRHQENKIVGKEIGGLNTAREHELVEETNETNRLKELGQNRDDKFSPMNIEYRANQIAARLVADMESLYIRILHIKEGVKLVFPIETKLIRLADAYPKITTIVNTPAGDVNLEMDLWLKSIEEELRRVLQDDYEFNLTVSTKKHLSDDGIEFPNDLSKSGTTSLGTVTLDLSSYATSKLFMAAQPVRLRTVGVSVITKETSETLWRCTVRPPKQRQVADLNIPVLTAAYSQPRDCYFGQVGVFSRTAMEDSFRGRTLFNIDPFTGTWSLLFEEESTIGKKKVKDIADVLLHFKIALLPKDAGETNASEITNG